MKRLQRARRRRIVRELAHINREIAAEQRQLARLEARLTALARGKRTAA